jgi:hypothetical protein
MAHAKGMPDSETQSDIQTLNQALFFEHRAVWAYRAAGGKLSASEVGRAVRTIADENRADHEKHQTLLRKAVEGLGGAAIPMEQGYDLSSYIQKGYGNLDNDVNIAKLALAMEIGAAAGYVTDSTHLKSPAMIELEAGIACVEAMHVARIRIAFNELGIVVPVVANPVLNASSRTDWIMKV